MSDHHESEARIHVSHLSPDQVTTLARLVFEDDADADERLAGIQGVEEVAGYTIQEVLGEGASSIVYRVTRLGWNEQYALKMYRRPISDDTATQRAMREVDLAEQLTIPGMPRLLEHGIHNGHLFLVWDLVQGVPIDVYCQQHALDLRQRVDLLINVTRIIERLHQAGVIHRDLSPSNILVDGSGTPHVIDLGIARILEDTSRVPSLTGEGSPLGSVSFMAPEQARGETGLVSTRSDQYGLGAIAYYLLSEHTPHDMETSLLEALKRVGTQPPRSLHQLKPDLPRELGHVVMKAIASNPEDRYETAAAFREDLARWVAGYPVLAQSAPWWRRLQLSVRRRPQRWVWGSLSSAAIVVLSVLSVVGFVQSANARADAQFEQGMRAQAEAERTQAEQQLANTIQNRQEVIDERNEVLDTIIGIIEWIFELDAQGDLDDALGMLMVLDEAVKAANEFDGEVYQEFSDARFDIVLNALRALYNIEEGAVDPGFETVREALEQYEDSLVEAAPPMHPFFMDP